jgi:hypothetical protein
MEETINEIKKIISTIETYVPAVNENALKNYDAYRSIRELSKDGVNQFKKLSKESLAKFKSVYKKGKQA